MGGTKTLGLKNRLGSIGAYLLVFVLGTLAFVPWVYILYTASRTDVFVSGVIIWAIIGVFFWMHIRDRDSKDQ